MSSQDPAKSAAARAEGNTAYRQGKWAEAARHYTTAVDTNVADPLAYSNRAAAYLKLERYEEAFRDADSSLQRRPKDRKALYRRALASKGIGRYEDALKDLQDLLDEEQTSEIGEELAEVKAMRDKERQEKEKQAKADEAVAVSPPDVDGDVEMSPTPAKSSFAQLRKSRDTRKTYVSGTGLNTASPSQEVTREANVQETTPQQAPQQTPPKATRETTQHATQGPTPRPSRPISPPPNPKSTSPSSGITLLRRLSQLDPTEGWSYLHHYPPHILPVILNNLLEPDSLGTLLLVLRVGVESDAPFVKVAIDGLRQGSRWGINTMMLDQHQLQAGREAYSLAGGGAFQ